MLTTSVVIAMILSETPISLAITFGVVFWILSSAFIYLKIYHH